jgi:hypothetical protein
MVLGMSDDLPQLRLIVLIDHPDGGPKLRSGPFPGTIVALSELLKDQALAPFPREPRKPRQHRLKHPRDSRPSRCGSVGPYPLHSPH